MRLPKLARIYTVLRVFLLRLRGKKITIGKNSVISRKADLHIIEPLSIGCDCYIGCYSCLDTSGAEITIGDKTTMGRYCMIHGGAVLKDKIRIASHVCIIPGDHKYKDKNICIKDQGVIRGGVVVESDVWIGAQVSLLSGALIGKGCVVGAGAVVKGRLDEYGVYAGIPAKRISQRA